MTRIAWAKRSFSIKIFSNKQKTQFTFAWSSDLYFVIVYFFIRSLETPGILFYYIFNTLGCEQKLQHRRTVQLLPSDSNPLCVSVKTLELWSSWFSFLLVFIVIKLLFSYKKKLWKANEMIWLIIFIFHSVVYNLCWVVLNPTQCSLFSTFFREQYLHKKSRENDVASLHSLRPIIICRLTFASILERWRNDRTLSRWAHTN